MKGKNPEPLDNETSWRIKDWALKPVHPAWLNATNYVALIAMIVISIAGFRGLIRDDVVTVLLFLLLPLPVSMLMHLSTDLARHLKRERRERLTRGKERRR